MAPLSPASVAAIARLTSYNPPPPKAWHALPLTRRAAVLILLYAGADGELRVVLTMRAAGLRNYASQAALPGGKADSLTEQPVEVARREAFEEIGLPVDRTPSSNSSTTTSPPPFTTTPLTQLPTHLARTALAVRPCVALLSPTIDYSHIANDKAATKDIPEPPPPTPRLDAKEVAEVFSAPLRDFLLLHPAPSPTPASTSTPAPQSNDDNNNRENLKEWYQGHWINWHDTRFRMHSFHVPLTPANKITSKPQQRSHATRRNALAPEQHQPRPQSQATPTPTPTAPQPQPNQPPAPEEPTKNKTHNTVFGMTARILVECARIAYGVPPEFEHSEAMGDEALIERLMGRGLLDERNAGEDQRSAGWAWFTRTEEARRRRKTTTKTTTTKATEGRRDRGARL